MAEQRARLTAADRASLEARGVSVQDVLEQLVLLENPRRYVRLDRPCTTGDGIVQIDERGAAEWLAAHRAAADAGRFVKFVPASGAATRMFKGLVGDGAPEVEAFVAGIERFAFFGDLVDDPDAPLPDAAALVERLLSPEGLGYAGLPKGLLKFHRHAASGRTAFEEHLLEAAHYVRDAAGSCRLHFTVSPAHRSLFEDHLRQVGPGHGSERDARFDVGWSEQKRSTDTVAIDEAGAVARDEGGEPLLRPGGHGALIENLHDLAADLIYIKNIDNVQPDDARQPTLLWKQILGGYLVRLQQQIVDRVSRLRAGPDDGAVDFLRETFGLEPPEGDAERRRRWALTRLDRPARVCGVVRNTGEPGGGPFWVREASGAVTAQIVEAAEVDRSDARQSRELASATHFNPVDLVCSVRNDRGEPFDLHRFLDRERAIVTRKAAGGRDLRVLERPGLWNGAMAHWNTVFVEVPLATFTPVKTVLDLLRDEHQPRAIGGAA